MKVTMSEAKPKDDGLRLRDLKKGDFFEVIEPSYHSRGIIIEDNDSGGLVIVRLFADQRVYATPMSTTVCGDHAVRRLLPGTQFILEAE